MPLVGVCPESRQRAGREALAWTLNREMGSHLYARFITLVGGVLDGGTWCYVEEAPELRGKDAYTLRQGI